MPDFKAYVRAELGASGLEAEQEEKVVEEVASQLEEYYEELCATGRSPEQAWAEIERQVPDWRKLRSEVFASAPFTRRAQRTAGAGAQRTWLAGLRELGTRGVTQDLRLGLRRALKDRVFAAVMLVTLAVCLGANAAIFTVVHSVILRPLPLPDGERIVAFADQFPTQDPNFAMLNNVRSYFDRPAGVPAVEDQAMFRPASRAIDIDGRAEQTAGLEVTASFFALVRTPPALGRPFVDADSEIGNEQKVILSDGLWRQMFAADPAAIGRDVELEGRPFTIVGVMPARFSFFDPAVRYWLPLTFTEDQRTIDVPNTRLVYGWYHMGRLAPGADVAQAQAQVDALNAANVTRFPQIAPIWVNTGFHTVVIRLHDALVRDVSDVLYLLWAAAGFVLLIGAINLANLTLARSGARARDLATRVAIGASQLRIARLLAIEGASIGAVGGVLGLLVGALTLYTVRAQIDAMPGGITVDVGWPVIALVLAAAVAVGVLVGLASAAGLRTPALSRLLVEQSRGGTGGPRTRMLRRGLVVAQIAISMVLLVGAGLLLVSFRNLLDSDPGFDAANVVTASVRVPTTRYVDDTAVREFGDRFLAAVRAVPGVESAGFTTNVPMGVGGGWGPIIAEDYEAAPGESVVSPWRIVITPDYLGSMDTTLVRGRGFDAGDRADTEHVMLIDESLARRFWGDRDPVGTRMYRPTDPEDLGRTDENTEFYRVVGIVRNVELRDLAGKGGRAFGAFYLPYAQWPQRFVYVVIKTRSAPGPVMEAVRAELATLDPELPLSDVRTMTQRTDLSLASRRLAAGLAATFGGVALFLAALGVYGVLAYLVAQRRREIGIRIALGSPPRDIFGLVLREGLWLTCVGLLVGFGGALAVARSLEEQVFGIAPTDPFVLGGVALITGLIALLACISPARRATRVDPLVVLNDS